MRFVLDQIESRGGLAYTHELHRIPRNVLDVAAMYGTVLHVKKGLWALPTLDPLVIAGQRAGGRLACVSALEFHGVIEPGNALHICAPAGVVSWRPRSRADDVIRHWSRRPKPGECRGVAGREVRLRRTDSL